MPDIKKRSINESHKIAKKRNRLKRCRRRVIDPDVPFEQRNRILERIGILDKEVKI